MHDACNPVKSRFFLLSDVSVAFEVDDVPFSLYYSVDQDIAPYVAHEGHCAFTDVLIGPWTKGDLVSQMEQERVHAVTFRCEGNARSFSNQFADFDEHNLLVYCNLLCHFEYHRCSVQKYG